MRTFLLATTVFAFTLIGCSSNKVTNNDIYDSEWELTEYIDNSGSVINNDDNIIISFRDSAMVAGNTGCNLFIGKYSLNESKIKFENIGSTKVFCGEDKAQKEQNYLNALSLELEAEISSNGEELILKNAEKGIKIKYIKCKESKTPEIK